MVSVQASAQTLRQRAQGVGADTAFLQDQAEPLDADARQAAELASAEQQYQKQLDREIGVCNLRSSRLYLIEALAC